MAEGMRVEPMADGARSERRGSTSARFSVTIELHVVWVFRDHTMAPFDAYAKPQRVFLAGCDLADREHAFASALKSQRNVLVSVGRKKRQIRANAGDAIAGPVSTRSVRACRCRRSRRCRLAGSFAMTPV